MTRVIIGEDCGNSPKNIFVQEITIALAKGDVKSVLNSVTEDIRWSIVGDRVLQGTEQFVEALQEQKNEKVVELNIHHIATHGKAGAVDGALKFKHKSHAFCYVYEFSNAKGILVKEITSYIIEIK
jgi:hypothetical protein